MPPKNCKFSRHRKIAIERKFLGHVANVLAPCLRVAGHIDTGDKNLALAGPQQATKHADDGRFAGAVGTDKAHDLAGRDREIDVIDSHEGAEALGQILARRSPATCSPGRSCGALPSFSRVTKRSSMVGAFARGRSKGKSPRCSALLSSGRRRAASSTATRTLPPASRTLRRRAGGAITARIPRGALEATDRIAP